MRCPLAPALLAAALLAMPNARAEEAAASADAPGAADVQPTSQAAAPAGGGAAAAVAVARRLDPYLSVVGGVEAEHVVQPADGSREDRVTTLALSRFGIRGQVAEGVYVESELEVNAGPHGTSVWEGQAALQVRNQLVRLSRGRWRLDVGRVTDPASLNFFSAHVADQLLMDSYTRTALLYAGFNRGNGVYGAVDLAEGLSLGLAVNAANPTSMTGAVMIGGTFPPFSRFYFAPYSNVGRDAASMPTDTYHVYLVSPSIQLRTQAVSAQLEWQGFQANTNTGADDDDRITGFNSRAGVKVRALKGRVVPFANGSFLRNGVVDPEDGKSVSDVRYESVTASAGLDINPVERLGFGVQGDWVREQQGEEAARRLRFLNVGATWWIAPSTSVGLRGAYYQVLSDAESFAGPVGERSLFATVRVML